MGLDSLGGVRQVNPEVTCGVCQVNLKATGGLHQVTPEVSDSENLSEPNSLSVVRLQLLISNA